MQWYSERQVFNKNIEIIAWGVSWFVGKIILWYHNPVGLNNQKVDISMLGCIDTGITKSQHTKPTRSQNSPYKIFPTKYGKRYKQFRSTTTHPLQVTHKACLLFGGHTILWMKKQLILTWLLISASSRYANPDEALLIRLLPSSGEPLSFLYDHLTMLPRNNNATE